MNKFGLKTLSLITDLIPAQFEAEILDRGDYLVWKTSSQPNYFWGNFLIFREAPERDVFKDWKRLYQMEFETENPTFYTFTWDSPNFNPTYLKSFMDHGFRLDIETTLVTKRPELPPKINKDIVVKPIVSEADWNSLPEVHVNPNSSRSIDSQIEFQKSRIKTFKELSKRKFGHRFGAYLEGKLVGDLGLYHQDGIARFNEVATHHEYYRRGICQTLVYHSCIHAIENFEVSTLVMVAVDDYHAINAYKKVGFTALEKSYSLTWWDRKIFGEM
ncbi:GNAT family N-acetyltransferase [bacterium]|nr:GNAT family N-acetyltransferase [bacterium]